VHVDDARHECKAAGIDALFRSVAYLSDRDHLPLRDRDIRLPRRRAGSVVHCGAVNQKVEHDGDLNRPQERAFGRYRILEEIGRGAMGRVYRAQDPLIERELAIKTLSPDLPADTAAEVRERFLREARSAGKLSHPNIVIVYDVGEQDGEAYIAMELLAGRPLKELLSEPLAPDTAAGLAAQVADALHHAHASSIVHRDVKPANIVVSDSGQAKLTDFGMAWVPSSTMTQAGVALGSPKYMSPEQVTGQAVEPRSDVFCLGVVLYEMLTGRSPFARDDDTPFDVMDRIAGEPHPPLREANPVIPAAFEAIIDRALAKNPEARYASAAEMAEALRACVAPPATEDTVRRQLMVGLGKFERDFDFEEAARVAPETSRPALDILRAQAAALEGSTPSARARTIAALDLAMRAAEQYFGEFAKLLNSVEPASGAPYHFLYLDPLAAPLLRQAAVESKSLTLPVKEVCAEVRFRFLATPPSPVATRVKDEDVPRCEEYLKNLSAAFRTNGPVFTVIDGLPCEIILRANYEAGSVAAELINVRRVGTMQKQLDAATLKAALDSLGRYVLGIDDEFVTTAA
jgi:serine/threonine protein kinase